MLLKYFGAREARMGRVGRETYEPRMYRADAIIFRKAGWAGSQFARCFPFYFSPTPILVLFLDDGTYKGA